MAFLEKAEKQDSILWAGELNQKVSDKMTVIDLKDIIIGSKDYEEEFVEAYLSIISEERVERETEKVPPGSTVVHVKGEQGILNTDIDTGAQIPVITAGVVEGQIIDNKGTIQITPAFWEHEMGLMENSPLVRNPAILREPSKEEGIINSTDSKSVCSQEVVFDLRPETYTQSLSNAPNENSVVVESNATNFQTNGQGIKESNIKDALSADSWIPRITLFSLEVLENAGNLM
ncbi:hypothetical protein TNIN_34271 [Trichonephila inaurata madagascariensis]|uniref:Uncharacterized protein n=1 Tax=Trichonephila inaurata madagascariensis TaxID=2747483 RepID=A0A8X6XNP2_9ARAC|nr:hypothetical protein TNIN_34271 [Trichonephila inaurata madagascariensis]